jgi:hypothetical protein
MQHRGRRLLGSQAQVQLRPLMEAAGIEPAKIAPSGVPNR